MRIGTWNVEYALGVEKNARRLRRLVAMDCDVWILTETHDDLALGPEYASASTAQRETGRAGARWTTIWSKYPIEAALAAEDAHRTVAARLRTPEGPLLVFGTVLPWHSDGGPAGDARNWSEFYRVAPAQAAEWAALRAGAPGVPLCVAGDLNMNLGGPHYYGTNKGREQLRAGLREADLVCTTETERVPAGMLAYPNIDHVCLSSELAARACVTQAWRGTDDDGVRLSDHSGLVVEVAPGGT